MEELACCGAVDPNFIDFRRVGADIFNVPEDVTETVLRNEVAQVGPEAHVGDCRFVESPGLNREAFEQNEAFAVEDFVAHGTEEAFHCWKREILLGSVSNIACWVNKE